MRWADRIYYEEAHEFRQKLMEPWKIGDKMVGVKKSAGLLELRIVFKAGHLVPMDQPEASLDMATSFVNRVVRMTAFEWCVRIIQTISITIFKVTNTDINLPCCLLKFGFLHYSTCCSCPRLRRQIGLEIPCYPCWNARSLQKDYSCISSNPGRAKVIPQFAFQFPHVNSHIFRRLYRLLKSEWSDGFLQEWRQLLPE